MGLLAIRTQKLFFFKVIRHWILILILLIHLRFYHLLYLLIQQHLLINRTQILFFHFIFVNLKSFYLKLLFISMIKNDLKNFKI